MSSIGIIGGSDGPTAIFITSSHDYLWLIIGIAAVICAVITLVIWRRRKR